MPFESCSAGGMCDETFEQKQTPKRVLGVPVVRSPSPVDSMVMLVFNGAGAIVRLQLEDAE
jgi:hypothetical protein